MTPAKGKSPLDKKKKSTFNSTTHPNSIKGKINRGEFTLPGKSKEETKKLLREWEKQHRFNSVAMERWYHTQVQDTEPHASTT